MSTGFGMAILLPQAAHTVSVTEPASPYAPGQPSKWQCIHGIRGLVNRVMGRIPDPRDDGHHSAPHAHRHGRHFGQETPGQPQYQQQEYQPSDSVHRDASFTRSLRVESQTTRQIIDSKATGLCAHWVRGNTHKLTRLYRM